MSTFVLKNLRRLFDKYTVARTEQYALVKSTTKIFSNFVAFSENPSFMKYELVHFAILVSINLFVLLCWQFWHRNVSAQGYFSTMDVPARDVTGLGHFITGTFHHMDISAHVDFGTIQNNIPKCLPAPNHPRLV